MTEPFTKRFSLAAGASRFIRDILRAAEAAEVRDRIALTINGLLRMEVAFQREYGVPAEYLIVHTNVWMRMVADRDFVLNAEMAKAHSVLTAEASNGKLCTLFGLAVFSDVYFQPEDRILTDENLFALGAHDTTGRLRITRGEV